MTEGEPHTAIGALVRDYHDTALGSSAAYASLDASVVALRQLADLLLQQPIVAKVEADGVNYLDAESNEWRRGIARCLVNLDDIGATLGAIANADGRRPVLEGQLRTRDLAALTATWPARASGAIPPNPFAAAGQRR